jgi:hypothetical protein
MENIRFGWLDVLPFLGYLLFPERVRLARRNKKRFIEKSRLYDHYLQKGEWSQKAFANHIMPLVACTEYANAREFRKNVLRWWPLKKKCINRGFEPKTPSLMLGIGRTSRIAVSNMTDIFFLDKKLLFFITCQQAARPHCHASQS